MRYLFLFILITACGFKPHANCISVSEGNNKVQEEKTATQEIIDNVKKCVTQPTLGVSKEF
jgi:hypothetical protein